MATTEEAHLCPFCWFGRCNNDKTGDPCFMDGCACFCREGNEMPQDLRRVAYSGSPLVHLVGTARLQPEVALCGVSPYPEAWQDTGGTRFCTACIDKAVKL